MEYAVQAINIFTCLVWGIFFGVLVIAIVMGIFRPKH